MHGPFPVPKGGCTLKAPFPDPDRFLELIRAFEPKQCELVVRQWLTEGVPFAFRGCPLLYEVARTWVGSMLEVSPHDVTIIGSGRIGFSLAPPPDWGRMFNPKSDLDFAIVSRDLFKATSEAFFKWKADYEAGLVKPRGDKEKGYWDENLRHVQKNLPSGVLDPGKIPTWDQYQISQRIRECSRQLHLRLQASTPALPSCGASFRLYREWNALTWRVTRNLNSVVSIMG